MRFLIFYVQHAPVPSTTFHPPAQRTHIFYVILFDFIIESHPQCFKNESTEKEPKGNRIKYLLNYAMATTGRESETASRLDSQ